MSGAHLNPAVTAAAWVWGSLSLTVSLAYILAQMVGALAGYGILLVRHFPTWLTVCSIKLFQGVINAWLTSFIEVRLSSLRSLNHAITRGFAERNPINYNYGAFFSDSHKTLKIAFAHWLVHLQKITVGISECLSGILKARENGWIFSSLEVVLGLWAAPGFGTLHDKPDKRIGCTASVWVVKSTILKS